MESLYGQGSALAPSVPNKMLSACAESWLAAQPFRLPKFRWIKVKPHMYSRQYFGGALCVTDINQLPLGCQTYEELNHHYHTSCARMFLMKYLYYRNRTIVQAIVLCSLSPEHADYPMAMTEFVRLAEISSSAQSGFRDCMCARRRKFGYQPLSDGGNSLSELTIRLIKWLGHLCAVYSQYAHSDEAIASVVTGSITRYLQRALNRAFNTNRFHDADISYLVAYVYSYLNERTCYRHYCDGKWRVTQIESRTCHLDAAFRDHTHVSRVIDSLMPIHCNDALPDIISQHTDIIGEEHLVLTKGLFVQSAQ